MKKIILSAAALLVSLIGFTEEVTMNKAYTVARHFLPGAADVKFTASWTDGNGAAAKAPDFFLFNGGASWVIVAADDIATPVLMHGEGHLEISGIPDNMRSYLEAMIVDIREAKAKGVTQSSGIKAKWDELSTAPCLTSPSQKVLHTARWSQGSPYNDQCPMDSHSRSVTGCVATAMAIVMRYHEWPARGMGQTAAYTTESNNIYVPSRDLEHEYDWNSMPSTTAEFATSQQREAVATLMADCGAMVMMDYTASGSGAFSSDIVPALVEHMSYSPNAKEKYRASYTNAEWFEMLKTEIDGNRPVIYGGSDIYGNGGHQFVCDGYNSNGEVRFNWGWGYPEAESTWCAVSYLDAGSYVFSLYDRAILGLEPDDDPDTPTHPYGSLTYYQDGLELASGSLRMGESFSLRFTVFNLGDGPYSGSIYVLLVDHSGAVKEQIDEIPDLTISQNNGIGGTISKCRITGDTALGDRVCLGYSDGEGHIQLIRPYFYYNTVPAYLGVYDVNIIDIPSEMVGGQIWYPAIIRGSGSTGSKAIVDVKWLIDNVEVDSESVRMISGSHVVKARLTFKDNSTETIVKKIVVD